MGGGATLAVVVVSNVGRMAEVDEGRPESANPPSISGHQEPSCSPLSFPPFPASPEEENP